MCAKGREEMVRESAGPGNPETDRRSPSTPGGESQLERGPKRRGEGSAIIVNYVERNGLADQQRRKGERSGRGRKEDDMKEGGFRKNGRLENSLLSAEVGSRPAKRLRTRQKRKTPRVGERNKNMGIKGKR